MLEGSCSKQSQLAFYTDLLFAVCRTDCDWQIVFKKQFIRVKNLKSPSNFVYCCSALCVRTAKVTDMSMLPLKPVQVVSLTRDLAYSSRLALALGLFGNVCRGCKWQVGGDLHG